MDEEYLAIVLAHIGSESHLVEKVEAGGTVDRALERRDLLASRIEGALSTDTTGRVVLTPEPERIDRVLVKIAAGLFFVRYRRVAALKEFGPVKTFPYNIEDHRPQRLVAQMWYPSFRPKPWVHVQPGVFSFIVIRDVRSARLLCVMDLSRTLWGVVGFPNPQGSVNQVWASQFDFWRR